MTKVVGSLAKMGQRLSWNSSHLFLLKSMHSMKRIKFNLLLIMASNIDDCSFYNCDFRISQRTLKMTSFMYVPFGRFF